jgi:4-hydroxybenzoate polyprenyltransferase
MTITASTASSTATQEPLAPIARPSLRGHLAIMRIDHWVKQVFVLPGIAIALTSDVTHITTRAWWTVPLGMVAVCLVSSSNYVINEVLDAPSDLSHPIKRTFSGLRSRSSASASRFRSTSSSA